jgi:hypothetical protein
MGSWIQCPCGQSLHTNPFAGAEVYRLIKDSEYDAVADPVGRDQLEALFMEAGRSVYRCSQCGRLAVEWDPSRVTFYTPSAPPAPPPATSKEEQLLKEKETQAEAEYTALYESTAYTARYSETKEAFHDAIALARKLGREADVKRLEERLQTIKEIFRRQFPGS